MRSLGVGLYFAFEIMASSVSPFVVDICNMWHINPIVCISLFGLSGCVACLFLKETLGQEALSNEIEEIAKGSKYVELAHI